jgi:phosphohistidine swiveling domain-containing protein
VILASSDPENFVSRSGYVEPLRTATPEAALLGGKGASLCRLVGLGYRVPPGFVLTRNAFTATIDALGLSPLVEALSQSLAGRGAVAALGDAVRLRLLKGSIPAPVLEPVLQAVTELGLWVNNRAGIIVRSSATVEDSAAHSFAGIFESIPVAVPMELESVIREVWASVFSPRALTYFNEIGLQQIPVMAVVIQRFLAAERSGVMFTRFPGPNGQPRILVEHVEGGCEKLVKGEVTPERVWLMHSQTPPELTNSSLTSAHAGQLAQLAIGLEELFGAPQDVEWVIHDDAVHIVQSRPITVTFSRPRASVEVSIRRSESAPILTGVPASPGVGSGLVHLVFNIEQALALQNGQVLVTPMTNPDMVVAMRNSAAIITDVGGMICHAAIVSRELGLPCVVGTEKASATLRAGEPVTVDGCQGAVYAGLIDIAHPAEATRPGEWTDIWSVWVEATRGRTDLMPLVSTAEALEALPAGIDAAALLPDIDLRADCRGLWNDLEGMAPNARMGVLDNYMQRIARLARERSLSRLYLMPLGSMPTEWVAGAIRRAAEPCLVLHEEAPDAPNPVLDPSACWPAGRAAVPVGSAAGVRAGHAGPQPSVGEMHDARAAALDTIKFFGHQPGIKVSAMPDPAFRRCWWNLLPEYARFHREFATESERRDFEWLEVRPELVISALLKSLVQPGFEMVPRVLGFRHLPPLHIKWVKCRYHFRADTFAQVWQAIVRATWDEAYMADLMRRVRGSYELLREVLVLFPTTDEELAALSGERIMALFTSWWPRWVEFFALCWFIQAQGDDILYPFLEETVRDNMARIEAPPGDFSWPGITDLIAPTTPVLSGEYMADVGQLRQVLHAAGLCTLEQAEMALARQAHPEVAGQLAEHLRKWHWMRDRDLLFEPWDTPSRVIATALKTEPHAPVAYEANRRRHILALAFHADLAHAAGRAIGMNHAARFLHDLNVERENHHVLWLKYSYPLRRLFVEIEKRLIRAGSLEPGDIFFLQAPELIQAARNLPEPLPLSLIEQVKNRRRGYLWEARLIPREGTPPVAEDDYY